MKTTTNSPEAGYQRRHCSKCAEDLSFTESDPCDKCTNAAEAQPQGGELLPCPFCSGTKLRIKLDDVTYLKPHCWIVICQDCGANGANKSSESAAKEAWNTRADLPRATADGSWASRPAQHGYYWARQGDYLDFVEVDDGPYMRGFKLSGKTQEFVDAGWKFLGPITPRATGETIEAALAELREMFPDEHDPAIGKFISVKRQEFIDSNHAEVSRTSHIYIGYGQSPPSCSAATLDEAMAQVRAATRTEGEGEKL